MLHKFKKNKLTKQEVKHIKGGRPHCEDYEILEWRNGRWVCVAFM